MCTIEPSRKRSSARADLRVLKTPRGVPQANAFCERVIGTVRRECLDHLIPLNERHLRQILSGWCLITITAAARESRSGDSPGDTAGGATINRPPASARTSGRSQSNSRRPSSRIPSRAGRRVGYCGVQPTIFRSGSRSGSLRHHHFAPPRAAANPVWNWSALGRRRPRQPSGATGPP